MATADHDVEMKEKDIVVDMGAEAGGDDANDPLLENPNSPTKKFLNVCAKLLPPWFMFVILGCIALWIAGFVETKDLVYGILALNLITAFLGAWAVYMYGVIGDQIDRLREQNKQYESMITDLKETRGLLTGEVDGIQQNVDSLQNDASVLEENVSAFDPLLKELEAVAGDNQEIANIIESTNSMFRDMRTTMLTNEKAALLSAFYSASLRDGDNKMNKNEYRRFLGKLTKAQRKKFEDLGTFEELAGDDNVIDLHEFEEMLNKVLQDVDDMLKAQLDGSD